LRAQVYLSMQHKTYSKQRKPNSALRNRIARRSRAWWRTGLIWRRSTRTCDWRTPRQPNPLSSGWRLASRSVILRVTHSSPVFHIPMSTPSISVSLTHCLYSSLCLCLAPNPTYLSLTACHPSSRICEPLKSYVSASECVCMSASISGNSVGKVSMKKWLIS